MVILRDLRSITHPGHVSEYETDERVFEQDSDMISCEVDR